MAAEMRVFLLRAPESEEPMFSKEYQGELRLFSSEAKPTGQRAFAMDSATGGGGGLGEFIFGDVGKAVISSIVSAGVAYITARAGRKVKIKVGDVELEAGSPEQLREMIPMLEELRKAGEKDSKANPGEWSDS